MIDDGEYIFDVLADECDARVCAQLLAEEFVVYEPFTHASAVSCKTFYDGVALPTTLELLPDGLSFFARHRSTGDIVAVVTAGDLFAAHKNHPYEPDGPPALMPILDILDELDHLFVTHDFREELKPNMVLHIWMGATPVEHAGKDIATRLRKLVCDYARDKRGFRYALIQATNPATRQIYLKKLNGQVVREIDPKTWIWKKRADGASCPLKDFEGHAIPNILVPLTSQANDQ